MHSWTGPIWTDDRSRSAANLLDFQVFVGKTCVPGQVNAAKPQTGTSRRSGRQIEDNWCRTLASLPWAGGKNTLVASHGHVGLLHGYLLHGAKRTPFLTFGQPSLAELLPEAGSRVDDADRGVPSIAFKRRKPPSNLRFWQGPAPAVKQVDVLWTVVHHRRSHTSSVFQKRTHETGS